MGKIHISKTPEIVKEERIFLELTGIAASDGKNHTKAVA